jgi:ABC-2 type transport system ATP-binding protein
MKENIINIKNLSKIYKSKKANILANDNINLTVKRGEIVAILGPNGAGKSTLVKQIIGYLSPTKGNIELFGKDLSKNDRTIMKKIGYMMQSRYGHWDHLSVYDAIYYSGRLKKLSHKQVNNEIEYLINRLDLKNEINRKIKTLSGGKKQITALACVVVGNPELIILDEPTNGLDPEKRFLFWNYLKELNNEKNTTIVIVTHNVSEIEEIAHRVVIIGDAKVLREGTPCELKSEINKQIRIELEFDMNISDNIIFKNFTSCIWSEDMKKVFMHISESDLILCISKLFGSDINKNIVNIQIFRTNLEDIYIKIMGEKMNEKI